MRRGLSNESDIPEYLLAVHTLHGELLLIAGHTEIVVLLWDEALGANGLLASLAGETGLMPAVPLVLHLPGAFRETQDTTEKNNNTGFNILFFVKNLEFSSLENIL